MTGHACDVFFFFFNDTATTEIYTLSLHDALPICMGDTTYTWMIFLNDTYAVFRAGPHLLYKRDRKSTRLNSSHSQISYAVFCLKKKKLPGNRTNVQSLAVHAHRASVLCNGRLRES